MASFNPYSQYLNVQFGTLDQGKLILMAYDGALRFCRSAENCMASGDRQGKGEALAKAFDVVAEMRSSLRPEAGGELADHLNRAYTFVNHQITMANVMNKVEYLHNAIMMLEKLRDAWEQIVELPAPQAMAS